MVKPESDPPQSKLEVRDAGLRAYLASALSRAGTLQLTPEESKTLKEPFGDECFITGAAGDDALIYVEPPHLRNRMDATFGIGQWSFVQLRDWSEEYKTSKGFKAVRLYSEGALIVRGVYVTQAVGDMSYYPDNPKTNYGDAYEGARATACAGALNGSASGWRHGARPFRRAGSSARVQATRPPLPPRLHRRRPPNPRPSNPLRPRLRRPTHAPTSWINWVARRKVRRGRTSPASCGQ